MGSSGINISKYQHWSWIFELLALITIILLSCYFVVFAPPNGKQRHTHTQRERESSRPLHYTFIYLFICSFALHVSYQNIFRLPCVWSHILWHQCMLHVHICISIIISSENFLITYRKLNIWIDFRLLHKRRNNFFEAMAAAFILFILFLLLLNWFSIPCNGILFCCFSIKSRKVFRALSPLA